MESDVEAGPIIGSDYMETRCDADFGERWQFGLEQHGWPGAKSNTYSPAMLFSIPKSDPASNAFVIGMDLDWFAVIERTEELSGYDFSSCGNITEPRVITMRSPQCGGEGQ
jgi:hypothetical protein